MRAVPPFATVLARNVALSLAVPVFVLASGPLRAEPALLTRASAEVDLRGAPALAAHIRRTLSGRIAAELYNRPVRGYPAGSRLIVRVQEVNLSQGGRDPFARGEGSGWTFWPDSIRGEIRVVGPGGQVIERKRIAASPRFGGFGASQPRETHRVQALVDSLAYRAVHAIGR